MNRSLPLLALFALAALLCLPAQVTRAQAGTESPPAIQKQAATLGVDPSSPLGHALLSFDPEVYQQELLWWACDERDGREPATEGARQAAERAIRYFKQFGCRPMGEKKPGGGRSWFHSFSLGQRGLVVDPEKAVLSIRGRKLQMNRDWALLGGVRRAAVKADRLVHVGYGLKDEDMVRQEVKEAVVVAFEGAPGTQLDMTGGDNSKWIKRLKAKVQRAGEFGARALIIVPAPGHNRPLYLKRQNLVSRNLRKGVPLVQLSNRAASFLGRLFPGKKRVASCPVEIHFTRTVQHQGRNILALWPGSHPQLKKEYIVIGAHRDHLGVGMYASRGGRQTQGIIHNGADDNATGSVGVVELARALSSARLRPARSILFMLFDAEEMGLVGSSAWCADPTVPLKQVAAMINMDMIGRVRVNQATGRGGCTVMGSGNSPAWKKALDLATAHSPLNWVVSPSGFGGSDHLPFLRKGIPAIFFNSGLHRDYHTPRDDPEACNPQGAVEILKVLLHTAVTVADQEKRPEFKGVTRSSPVQWVRRGPQLGVYPQQTAEGILVRKVVEKSAADRAGLRQGDVLIALDGRKLQRASDIFRRLRRMKKGQEIKVTFKRDGRIMHKKVIL